MSSPSIRFRAAAWPLFALAALLAASLLPVEPVHAQDYKLGALEIGHPWARPSTARTGAAYLTVRNGGTEADALLRVETSAAEKAEIHEMKMEGTIMRMRSVERLALPAGETVTLAPGGLHIMLIGLKGPLKEGETLPLRLVFEKAGTIEVSAAIQMPGARATDTAKPAGGMDHMPGMDMH